MTRVLLVSGPNLDLLGERQPEVYGWARLEEHVARATERGGKLGMTVEHWQSNDEGAIVDAIHRARHEVDGIIINPGALTHYSWSLHDALAAFGGPVVELHLSNPATREQWRHTSVVAPVATGTIAGFGADGYRLAVEAMVALLADGSGASTPA